MQPPAGPTMQPPPRPLIYSLLPLQPAEGPSMHLPAGSSMQPPAGPCEDTQDENCSKIQKDAAYFLSMVFKRRLEVAKFTNL